MSRISYFTFLFAIFFSTQAFAACTDKEASNKLSDAVRTAVDEKKIVENPEDPNESCINDLADMDLTPGWALPDLGSVLADLMKSARDKACAAGNSLVGEVNSQTENINSGAAQVGKSPQLLIDSAGNSLGSQVDSAIDSQMNATLSPLTAPVEAVVDQGKASLGQAQGDANSAVVNIIGNIIQ